MTKSNRLADITAVLGVLDTLAVGDLLVAKTSIKPPTIRAGDKCIVSIVNYATFQVMTWRGETMWVSSSNIGHFERL